MRQNKLLLLLVLLVAVATGAWADSFSADAYAANATLNGVSVTANQTVTINEGVTVTVNNGLSIQSNATLTVTGGGTLVVNGANGADGQDEGLGVDPDMGEEVWVKATPGGNGNSGIVIDNGGNLIISNATIIAIGGKGGQGGKIEDESYAANGADGNGFASFPTIDGAVMSYSTNGTDYTEYASGDKTLYRYMKAVKVGPTTYSVTLADGTEDAENWDVPKEAAEGAKVTATYNGKKKVKSVKAVKVANVWDGDLSKLTAESTPEYATATDGMTITGTLAEGVNVKVSIADGATVTLDNVTINGVHKGDLDYMWAGLTCLGDATIILKDGTTNTITGFHNHFPAIYIPGDRHNPDNNKTLIIKGGDQGTGKLIARNNGRAAGIGGVQSATWLNQLEMSAGNIEIQGGDIEAYAGQNCAAIGAAASDTCGYIRITGGKILANGGSRGVGIGCGTGMNESSCEAHCGDITITGGNITAYGTGGAAIGSCSDGVCGNITISGGIVMAVGQGYGCPGIGSGYKEMFETRCGDILINGGVIQAVGLSSAPGIGSGGTGDQSGTCGNITITSGVTGLYAEGGTGATNSIGLADNEGQCGTVTIGGEVYWQNGNYVGEGAAYLQDNPIRYEP